MKAYAATRGWLFKLQGGPNNGQELRLGVRLPNGQRQRLGSEVWFPKGATYVAQPLCKKDGDPVLVAEKERGEWNAVRPDGIPEDQKAVYVYDRTEVRNAG